MAGLVIRWVEITHLEWVNIYMQVGPSMSPISFEKSINTVFKVDVWSSPIMNVKCHLRQHVVEHQLQSPVGSPTTILLWNHPFQVHSRTVDGFCSDIIRGDLTIHLLDPLVDRLASVDGRRINGLHW